ncbi:hypothetical protein IIB79_08235, partial [candidate division KSB1 bacterium]|nr:hypothetical protein [candidate division KSB1 bacterium]
MAGRNPGGETTDRVSGKKDGEKEIRNTLKNTPEHEYDTGVIDPPEVINALFKEEGLFRNFDPADEVIELRDQNTKHFRNADGTMSAIIGAGEIHYWEDGKWKMILSHILPHKTQEFKDYDFAAIHNKHKIFFPRNPGNPIVTKIRNELYEDWGQPAMVWLDSNANILSQVSYNTSSTGVANKDSLTYAGIFPYTDAVFLNSITTKKLSYILRDSSILTNMPAGSAYLAFRETIKTSSAWKLSGSKSDKNLFASLSTGQLLQDIMFIASGDSVLEIKAPVYYEYRPPALGPDTNSIDSTSRYEGSFLVRQSGSGYDSYTLVPLHWLTHPNRDFPIVVDPTTNYYPDNVWTYDPTYTTYRGNNSGNFYCTTWGVNYNRTYEYDISYGWADDTWPVANPFFDGYATFDISALQDNACINSVQYNWYRYDGRLCGTDVTLKFGMAQFNDNLANEADCNTIG